MFKVAFKDASAKNSEPTARTARFSKKSLGSDVGEIKKMSEKLKKKKSVFTPRNVREKSNTIKCRQNTDIDD
jgi:hypothetical protein